METEEKDEAGEPFVTAATAAEGAAAGEADEAAGPAVAGLSSWLEPTPTQGRE